MKARLSFSRVFKQHFRSGVQPVSRMLSHFIYTHTYKGSVRILRKRRRRRKRRASFSFSNFNVIPRKINMRTLRHAIHFCYVMRFSEDSEKKYLSTPSPRAGSCKNCVTPKMRAFLNETYANFSGVDYYTQYFAACKALYCPCHYIYTPNFAGCCYSIIIVRERETVYSEWKEEIKQIIK